MSIEILAVKTPMLWYLGKIPGGLYTYLELTESLRMGPGHRIHRVGIRWTQSQEAPLINPLLSVPGRSQVVGPPKGSPELFQYLH